MPDGKQSKIWKFDIHDAFFNSTSDAIEIDWHNAFGDQTAFAIPISAQLQGGRICVWVKIHNRAESGPRWINKLLIYIRGTGHTNIEIDGLQFLDTVQIEGLVLHIFYRWE